MTQRTLTPESAQAAAKAKARRARNRLQHAKAELDAAAATLERTLEAVDPDTVGEARQQATDAERTVHQAKADMDAAAELVQAPADGTAQKLPPIRLRHSGQGLASLLAHIRRRN